MPDRELEIETSQDKIDQALLDIKYGGISPPQPPIDTTGFSAVNVYRTTERVVLYQSAVGAYLSKFWTRSNPNDSGNVGPVVQAMIPKGTIVAVGMRAGQTQWYIPDTWSVKVTLTPSGERKPPSSWKVTKI